MNPMIHPPDLLVQWVTPEAIATAREALPSLEVPEEIVHVAAALRSLATTTKEFAGVLVPEGPHSEDAHRRAQAYQESLDRLMEVWNPVGMLARQ